MARHKKTTDEKYNQTFARIFRSLLDEPPRTSQAEIADAIGKSRQIVSQYYNGQSEPTFEVLVKIADFFEVSTDYLLGRTRDRSLTPSPVDSLGLTEENVRFLETITAINSVCAIPYAHVGDEDVEATEKIINKARSLFKTKELQDREHERVALGMLGDHYQNLINDLIFAASQDKQILSDYISVAVSSDDMLKRANTANRVTKSTLPKMPDICELLWENGYSSISLYDTIRFKSSEVGGAISKFILGKYGKRV